MLRHFHAIELFIDIKNEYKWIKVSGYGHDYYVSNPMSQRPYQLFTCI